MNSKKIYMLIIKYIYKANNIYKNLLNLTSISITWLVSSSGAILDFSSSVYMISSKISRDLNSTYSFNTWPLYSN